MFDPDNLHHIGRGQYRYVTDDAVETVTGAGYFADAEPMLHVGDVIDCIRVTFADSGAVESYDTSFRIAVTTADARGSGGTVATLLTADLTPPVVEVEATLRVPTDYDTIQEALDANSARPHKQGAVIEILIESGHQPATGTLIQSGDYGHFRIVSEDDEVQLSSSWVAGTPFMRGLNCRMPQWGIVLDCNGQDTGGSDSVGSGALCVEEGSDLVFYGTDKGVKNAGGTSTGLFVYRNSRVVADRGVFTGNALHGVWITHRSDAYLERADFSGNGDANAFISRGSILYAAGADFSDSGAEGLLCHRAIAVVLPFGSTNTVFDNNGSYAIYARNTSFVMAHERAPALVAFSNCQVHGVSAEEGSIVNVQGASFDGVASDVIRATDGGTVIATNVTTSGTIGGDGVFCDGSHVQAQNISLVNCGDRGIAATNSGRVVAPGATVSGSTTRDLEITTGGEILIHGGTYTTSNRPANVRYNEGLIAASYAPETVTGSTAMDPRNPSSLLNSAAGAVTTSLGSGPYESFVKVIRMSNAANASTVSVTNHTAGSPTVFTFNSTTDFLVLIWLGSRWGTLLNVGVT